MTDDTRIVSLKQRTGGLTWHIMERDDGSVSVYYTYRGSRAHWVVFDTLEHLPTPEVRMEANNA